MASSAPLLLRSYSCPEIEYSSVSSGQSCTGVRSLPTRAPVSRSLSPARPTRIQSSIKHRRANSAASSESCGSSPSPAGPLKFRTMSLTDLERHVFGFIQSSRNWQKYNPKWRATDPEVFGQLLDWVNMNTNINERMNSEQLKHVISDLEGKVRRCKTYGGELENSMALLRVFSYVSPEDNSQEVRSTQLPGPSSSKRLRRDYSCPSCSSLSGDSVTLETLKVCESPYNMSDCTRKLGRLGYGGDKLSAAVEIFVTYVQRRQSFMVMNDQDAATYISYILKNSVALETLRVCDSPYSMADCTIKLERLGYGGDKLSAAVEIFVTCDQRRESFMVMNDQDAANYISSLLKKFAT